MKTNAMKGIIIPLFITCLCLISFAPNNVVAQNKPVKNIKTVRVERAVEVRDGKIANKLTDDQKAKIKDLRLTHVKAIQLLKAESQELVAHLKTLKLAEKPDNKAIFKTIDELMANHGEIMKRSISFKQSVEALLTPEQLKEFQARHFKNQFGMGQRNQNWKHQGGKGFGRGQMMQRGGMNRMGQMNRPGQMMRGEQLPQRPMGPQGQMMNRRGQGFGGQMAPQGQKQRRFEVIREGQPKTPDTTIIK